ncbi:MAG: metalloregulator ArsR/SmtB family transcription factor [Parvularculaceae bacterium]|nr:helix-turn-helix transcriptional regulator [Parvularculaceae bacterium]
METKDALPGFAALAQENRLDALRRLVKAGPRGLSAGALSEEFGLAPPTMSFHLKELANAGLVSSRKEGRHVFYAADYGGIRRLVDFLMADCCQGDPRLCGPYVIKENSREPFACASEG